ncbi:MAG: GTP cyclohydrolase I FolE [candidate division NC10 bacterium]
MKPKPPVDQPAIERAVRAILKAVGEDPEREGLKDTPARVARMYAELFEGLRKDPRQDLKARFRESYDEVVLVKDIRFHSMCEHHLLPFTGQVHIGYLPNGQVLGLSKLARIVDTLAHRPQVQERLTTQIADLLETELKPKGVAVVMEAVHSCMTIRGVKKPGTSVTTSAMLGRFRSDAASRAEVLALLRCPHP